MVNITPAMRCQIDLIRGQMDCAAVRCSLRSIPYSEAGLKMLDAAFPLFQMPISGVQWPDDRRVVRNEKLLRGGA